MISFLALLMMMSMPQHPHQHEQHHPQPYAGMDERSVKALSERDVTELESGEGMGMALAAELNRFPGPKHVLELAEGLGLSEIQRSETQAVFDRMQAEAIRIGTEVVARERELDGLFATGDAEQAARAERLVVAIGRLRGELRWIHLEAHVATRRLLTEEQIDAYERHRGYTAP